MADRAARYGRRAPPSSADLPVAAAVAPLNLADRALRAGAAHRVAPERAPERPRPLSMSEIAARNHAVRTVDRAEPQTAPQTAEARHTLSMAERATRHGMTHKVLHDDKLERAQASPSAETARPVDHADAPTMADRAADQVRRHRHADVDQVVAADVAQLAETNSLLLGAQAVVLVSRNHGNGLAQRLQQWKNAVSGVDTRWLLLDLGSTDDSVAQAEALNLKILHRPGGLVDPLATLDWALQQITCELVLVADAQFAPPAQVSLLFTALRAGSTLSLTPSDRPSLAALSRKAWQTKGFIGHRDLQTWAQASGDITRLQLRAASADSRDFLARLCGPKPSRLGRLVARIAQIF